ncbi:MAG: carboxypeptidase regulatory-like domain-containing protein [Thermoplasmata archaeon]
MRASVKSHSFYMEIPYSISKRFFIIPIVLLILISILLLPIIDVLFKASLRASGQDIYANLSGYVIDGNGRPLPDATVLLQPYYVEARTDIEGHYRINFTINFANSSNSGNSSGNNSYNTDNISRSILTLIVTKEGYYTSTTFFTIGSGTSLSLQKRITVILRQHPSRTLIWKVIDNSGKAIPYADIMIKNSENTTFLKTDINGILQFEPPLNAGYGSADLVSVTVSAPGNLSSFYKEMKCELSLKLVNSGYFVFVLNKKSITTMLSGCVVNPNGEVLSNASVVLKRVGNSSEEEVIYQTSTDKDGQFVINSELERGVYVLIIEICGYTAKKIILDISDAPEQVFTFDASTLTISRKTSVSILPAIVIIALSFLIAIGVISYGYLGVEGIIFTFFILTIPLFFTRMKKESLLDNFVRGQIYDRIRTNPGITYTELKEALHVGNGTLAHHLYMLENFGFIKSLTAQGKKRFYSKEVVVKDNEGIRLSSLQSKILLIIESNPGCTQIEIANILNKRHSSVNYNIQALYKYGYIDLKKEGKYTRCFSKTRT